MIKISMREKMFMLLFFITLVLVISEYVYMNNHSVSTQLNKRTNELLRAGITLEQIERRIASEPSQRDGIYSPLVQLWLTGIVLCVGGLWFCMLLMLDDKDEVRTSYVIFGNIFLFWVIVFEIILFLWKILL